MLPTGSILGRAVRRTEDPRLLTGRARFVEDLECPGALHAAFVRSPLAHARIRSVHVHPAAGLPGVAGVFTGPDLALEPQRLSGVPEAFVRPPLATDVARFVGEPIAVVLAETRAGALDAAAEVWADLEGLPAVADPARAAGPDAPLLFPEAGTNVARRHRWGEPGAVDGADVVVRARLVNQRLAPVPLEPNGILAVPDGDDLTVWVPTQGPNWFRDELAERLGVPGGRIRVIAPAVGGGFGAKFDAYPEHVAVAALAMRLGRPVRYVETRAENLTSMTHGRAQVQEVELGANRDGVLTGLRVRVVADMGAYPSSTFLPALTRRMAAGVYRIPRVEFVADCVVTNTTPVSPYRGAGRPEATAMLERAVDLLAAELGVDPVELRLRNLVRGPFPHRTAAGAVYDSGDYVGALEEALRLARYDDLRKEQAERRGRGDVRQLGIGMSCYVEVTAWGSEFGSVEVHPDGTATVRTGTSPQGQGHETAFAQLVAGTLGIPFEAVRVVHSDTRAVPRGEGTSGSRSLQLGGSAILRAADRVSEKARSLAARVLEASVEDVVVFEDGAGVGVAGAPDAAIGWGELAAIAADRARLPRAMEPGLAAEADFEYGRANTYPFGAHVSVVEVDTETGAVRPLRHVAVDDCGRILNPLLVDGQVHGGVAQGLAQALYEGVEYDGEANPLTTSLAAYEVPTAVELPPIETAHTETPTPLNPLGAKGIGESGTIGSTPAVWNAVVDALSHLGVRNVDMPLSPERVWRAIRGASGGSGPPPASGDAIR